MYASIRRYRTANPADMDELLHLIDTDFAETIQEIDGFVAYECVDAGNGELCTISVFRDEEAARQSVDAAAQWVRDNLAAKYDIERLDVFNGEMSVSRARSEMLEPAHH